MNRKGKNAIVFKSRKPPGLQLFLTRFRGDFHEEYFNLPKIISFTSRSLYQTFFSSVINYFIYFFVMETFACQAKSANLSKRLHTFGANVS